MPIIKSAKKQLRQNRVHQKRNYQLRSRLKSSIKSIEKLAKEGKVDDAKKSLSTTYKIIDTAAKKNIIHKKNADKKKSKVMRAIVDASQKSKTQGAEESAKVGKVKKAEKSEKAEK